MIKKLLILFLLSAIGYSQAQTVDRYIQKISRKIKEDNTYLNLKAVSYSPLKPQELKEFSGIPLLNGEKYDFDFVDGVQYEFIFLPENIDFDEPVLLVVNKITPPPSGGGQEFFTVAATGPTEEVVLSFEDIQNLYFNHRDIYEKLLAKVKLLLKETEPESLLKIKIDSEVKKSRGLSAPDNLDYLNFSYVNSPHMFPPKPKTSKKGGRGFVRPGSRRSAGTQSPMKISAEFGKWTFFHKDYMNWDNNTISVEINTTNELLNVLPWQPMTMSVGIRSLIFLTGKNRNIQKDFIIDASLLGRFRVNTHGLVSYLPFMFSDPPRLNVGAGVEIKLSTTRAFGLPFLNFYFSSGTEDYNNPYAVFGKSDSSYAYFSFTQWLATMSFYWNSNQERNLRFRMDVGLGRYDISKAVYYKGTQTNLVFNRFQPYLKLYLNFVPKGNELFSANIRLFDSVLKFDFWLQLLKLKPAHTFRFYASYIGAPLYRRTHEWENAKSTMIGIIYRFGF